MRVVVYPHDLGVGGSQLNAIEIAAATGEIGCETILFGHRGPLVDRARELGLEFVPAPEPGPRPSVRIGRALAALCRERSVDVVHGYEWPPILEGVMASRLTGAVAVGTVMSMSVAPFIPQRLDLVVGTAQIGAFERERGRTRVHVIEPPVDVEHNAREAVGDLEDFRSRWGLGHDRLTVVLVTRLARDLKLEGILTAIEVVGELGGRLPIRLLIVGDGPERATVERAAAAANAVAGPGIVTLTGQMDDPRPAYAAADIALAMGGSALRALAFGTPLVVQGENGFWRLLTPETRADFQWSGWYGFGDGRSRGPGALRAILAPLVEDAAYRGQLAAFGLGLVRAEYSVRAAARRQVDVYRAAIDGRVGLATSDLAASALRLGVYKAKRIAAKVLRRAKSEDFNARPVVGQDAARASAAARSSGRSA